MGTPVAMSKPGPSRQAPAFTNPAFSSLVNVLLGPQQPQPAPSAADQAQTSDLSQEDSHGAATLPQAQASPQPAPAPVSASQLADAMMRSMFTSSSNVALINSAAVNSAAVNSTPTPTPAQKQAPAPSAPGALQEMAAPIIPPAVMAMLQSPLARSTDTVGKAALKLPLYASVIPNESKPAASKPIATAPLAFALKVTPMTEAAPKQVPAVPAQAPAPAAGRPAAQAPDQSAADEAAPAAPEALVDPEPQAAVGTAQDSKPASAASDASAPDAKTRPPQTHDDSVPAVAAVSAGASAGGGFNDSTSDFTRQMPAQATAETATAAIGKIQSPAAPTASEALRAAAPAAPATSAQPAAPLKEIAMRISSPQAPTVDVHLAERAGQLHIAVRTADGGLQTSLRQDLGTLVNSIERSGYRAEAFAPREGAPAAAATETNFQNGRQDQESEPGSKGGNQDSSQDSSQNSSQNPGGGGQQQQRRDSRPSKWIEELENQQ